MKVLRFILLILPTLYLINCNCLGQRKEIDSLLLCYKQLDTFSDSLQNSLLFNLTFYYLKVNSDSSIFFADQLIDRTEENAFWLYRAYLHKGNAYRLKGKFDLAVKNYYQSLKYASADNNIRGLGIVYCALGDVYSITRTPTKSIQYYNKAIDIFREQGDSIALASILLNASGEYEKGNTDSALVYLNDALDIFLRLNYKTGIAYCTGTIGKVFLSKKQFIEAEFNLQRAIYILEQLEDDYAIAAYCIIMADLLIEMRRNKEAEEYAQRALSIAIENDLLPQIRDSYDVLSDVYELKGYYKKAFSCKKKYYTYRDSILNEETIRKMADLQTEFEVSKKQVEVDKAQTQLELVKKEKQNQQIVGLGLILILFLTSTLAYIVFRNSKREKETNNVLREQKEELLSQKEELEAQKEELQTQRDIMEEINNTKDRLFSIISHDLRTPVGVLHWGTTLIKDALESKDYDKLWNFTGNMEKSVKNVQVLLDNLLEWAITQRGQYTLHPEETDLSECIDETVAFYTELAQSKEITLTHSPPPGKSFLTIDRNSLSTIVRNLLSNALKFTGNGGFVHILTERKKDSVTISIEDSGVGIPREKLKAIFSMKTKKSSRGTGQEKGLGIGLNLVYEFVKMNNGEIEVESTVGTGTIFTVRFPLHNAMSC